MRVLSPRKPTIAGVTAVGRCASDFGASNSPAFLILLSLLRGANSMSSDLVWHIIDGDGTVTEMTDEVLRRRLLDGALPRETMIWRVGMADWQAAEEVPGLFIPPQLPQILETEPRGPRAKVQPESGIGHESEPADEINWPIVEIEPQSDHAEESNKSALTGQGSGTNRNRKRTYFVRHWRGELSLGVSYWINGVLLTTAAGFAEGLLGSADITLAPRLLTAFSAAISVFLIIASVWQLVGIWRSAGRTIVMHVSRGETAFWARLSQIATMAGWLSLVGNAVIYRLPNAWANLQIAFGEDATPHHVLQLLNEGREIGLSGGIDFGTAADLATLLNASADVRTIDLNSSGGRVAEAQKLETLIKARGLSTYVAGQCASACTLAYLGGSRRYLGPQGKLEFHRYSFPGLTKAQDDAENQVGENDLVNSGVSREFAAKVFATASSSIWVPDTSTLLSANVVTQLVDGSTFSAAAAGEKPTGASVDKQFSAVLSFAALKRADPATYSHLVQDYLAGAEQGKSLEEITTQAHNAFVAAVAKYKILATDDVQVQIAALVGEEANLLANDHPEGCMTLVLGTPGPNYANYLPHATQQQDIALSSSIIEIGAATPSHVLATEKDATAEITQLWVAVRDSGLDISAVGRAATSTAEQRSTCIAMSAFMHGISLLPAQTAGPLMRYLEISK
jgi:hypothetical protein